MILISIPDVVYVKVVVNASCATLIVHASIPDSNDFPIVTFDDHLWAGIICKLPALITIMRYPPPRAQY